MCQVKVVMMATDLAAYYRQFLAGLILCVLAGTATIWWAGTWLLALAYFSGAVTVLVFTKLAPTYHPNTEEEDQEQHPGYQ